jgi:hypothetical protein
MSERPQDSFLEREPRIAIMAGFLREGHVSMAD